MERGGGGDGKKRQEVYRDFFLFRFSSSNCLLQFFRPLPSPTQKGKQGRKLSVQGKVKISLGGGGWGECTITAEARAFLYARPAPSACSMTHTHTHADIVDTKPSLCRGLFIFKCLRKWERKWKFHPPLLNMLCFMPCICTLGGLFFKMFVYVCIRAPLGAPSLPWHHFQTPRVSGSVSPGITFSPRWRRGRLDRLTDRWLSGRDKGRRGNTGGVGWGSDRRVERNHACARPWRR